MKATMRIILIFIILVFGSCKSKSSSNSEIKSDSLNLIESITLIKEPREYVKNYNGENNKLFVFVGKKLFFKKIPLDEYSMDNGFIAKYLIIQKVFGTFSYDTIEFISYDHYGVPYFLNFENSLLYVSSDSGTYFQQKYQADPLFKTIDEKWTGLCYSTHTGEDYYKDLKIKPHKIVLKDNLKFPIKEISKNGDTVNYVFSKPYYKIENDSAIPLYGLDIMDLFILKRDNVFTARGIFKDGELVK